MNFLESIKIAIGAIWTNKIRSFLTMLGIIIGVFSVIAVVSLGRGSQYMIGKEFEKFGVNRIYLSNNWKESPSKGDFLNPDDVEGLKRTFSKEIEGISPVLQESGKVFSKRDSIGIVLKGTNEFYNGIENMKIIKGRYLLRRDIKGQGEVAVIDENTALKIFGRTNVLGERLWVKTPSANGSFLIIGVYRAPKSPFLNIGNLEQPKYIYIPISTMERRMSFYDGSYGIEANLKKSKNIQEIMDGIIQFLERRHENERENKYRGYTAEGELEIANRIMRILTAVIGAIAAISLLVGGIGVMNIMLVSVTERTREIGIRKAIGAKRRDILLQFLVESMIISFLGGIIGTILGIGFSLAVAAIIKVPPTLSFWSIILACIFSGGVGIFFGIYPANRAAQLDPIEALRYE